VSKVVIDASALLQALQIERGADVVADYLGRAHISAANLCEVVSRLMDKGQTLYSAQRIVGSLALKVEPVDEAQSYAAAALRTSTRKAGLSLGDRICVALASRMGVPVVTADKAWAQLDLGVEVIVTR
jgi:PIN domain nuclease of toxin-antitoxin system